MTLSCLHRLQVIMKFANSTQLNCKQFVDAGKNPGNEQPTLAPLGLVCPPHWEFNTASGEIEEPEPWSIPRPSPHCCHTRAQRTQGCLDMGRPIIASICPRYAVDWPHGNGNLVPRPMRPPRM